MTLYIVDPLYLQVYDSKETIAEKKNITAQDA
jgi:hypothetical protein